MTDTPPTAPFFDDRLQLSHWYPRLAETDVPVPDTELVELEKNEDEDGFPATWDTEAIADIVAGFDGEAFVRSEYKSAFMHIQEGSYIPNTDHEAIDHTVMELLSQHMMGQVHTGGQLAIREWFDLDHCTYAQETLHPEVRYFIRDGEVLYSWPRIDPDRFERVANGDGLHQRALERIDQHRDDLNEYAAEVADAFADTGVGWSVDFVITTGWVGDVYCTDMALDALYYSENHEDWMNISEHEDGNQHNLEQQYAEEMEPPADDHYARS